MITKYYLDKMFNRLIEDVMWESKHNNMRLGQAEHLIANIKAEKQWALKKLRVKN